MKKTSLDFREQQQKQLAYEQAAEWYMLMQEQALTAIQQTEFDLWLSHSALHQQVWDNVTIFDEKFQRVPRQTIAQTIQKLEHQPAVIGKLSLLVISLFTGLYAYQGIRQQDYFPELLSFIPVDVYKTAIGEQQHVVLADGSQVWLNSASKLRVKYSDDQRHLELAQGEIYIETHKDQQHRQFTVKTKHGELLALGTVFNVRYFPKQTSLSVQEGVVRVSPKNHDFKDITAQHAITFDDHGIVSQSYQTTQSLWRHQMLVVHSMSLKQFTAELARYDSRTIVLEPSVENILISGAYSTKDVGRTIQMVANTHQLKIESRADGAWRVTNEWRTKN